MEVEMKKISVVHDSQIIIQASPPHQSSGEDQVIGVEDRGDAVRGPTESEEGGSWAVGVCQGKDNDDDVQV